MLETETETERGGRKRYIHMDTIMQNVIITNLCACAKCSIPAMDERYLCPYNNRCDILVTVDVHM